MFTHYRHACFNIVTRKACCRASYIACVFSPHPASCRVCSYLHLGLPIFAEFVRKSQGSICDSCSLQRWSQASRVCLLCAGYIAYNLHGLVTTVSLFSSTTVTQLCVCSLLVISDSCNSQQQLSQKSTVPDDKHFSCLVLLGWEL